MIQTYPMEMAPYGSLHDADYNPRELTPLMLDRLKASLAEFGFVEPVVARKEDGLVIGGHQRRLAFKLLLKDRGVADADIEKTPVPTIYVKGLTDAKAKVLNLALNKITGEWDYAKLPGVLESLMADLPAVEIEMSGFAIPEISDILGLVSHSQESLAQIAATTDVDAGVAQQARRFAFEVDNDEQVQVCIQALKRYGMTGPGNAGSAFVGAMRAALGKLS